MKKIYWIIILLMVIAAASGGAKAATKNDSDLILTWSSTSYTPVWYAPKTLPTSGSLVTVSASPEIIIQGKNLTSQDLEYQWYLDFKYQKAASGRGQQDFTFTAQGAKGTEANVKVDVYDQNGALLAEKSLKIRVEAPQVEIHALNDNQTLGLALKNNTILPSGTRTNFIAVPYFFNIADLSQLYFNWSFNNENVLGSATKPDIFTLKLLDGLTSGTAYVINSRVQNQANQKESVSNFLKITIQ